MTNTDVIGAFLVGTTSKELIHELGCKGPHTTRELLDIATNFASGEEAVGAIFHDTKGKEKRRRTLTRVAPATTPRRRRRLSSCARPPLWLPLSARTPEPLPRVAREFLTRCSRNRAHTTRV
jgi:hypothetical protein